MMQQEITQAQLELLDFLERDFQDLQQSHDRLTRKIEGIQSRLPLILSCDRVGFVGEHFEPPHQRLNFQLVNVRCYNSSLSTFNVIVNARDGVLDVEFHSAAEDRVFPLEQFIESGRTDSCAYMLLSPYERKKLETYLSLSEKDQETLQEILRMILHHIRSAEIEKNELTRSIDVGQWVDQIALMVDQLAWLSLNERLLGSKSDAFVKESGALRRLNGKLKRMLSGA